MAEDN